MGIEKLKVADHIASMDDPTTYHRTIARMFKSDFLEVFSKVHPAVPAVIFVPIVLYFGWQAVQVQSALGVVGALLAGLFVWSFTEYMLHRFLFHVPQGTWLGRFFYYYTHGIHHAYPDDYFRLVMVPAISLPLAWLFYGLFGATLPAAMVPGFFAGFVVGYLNYDYSHFATHHVTAPARGVLSGLGSVLKEQRRRHMIHHFKEPHLGYGVSTAFWDVVFGTKVSPRKAGD